MSERTIRSHHIPELDGVRGIAVLLVMLLHFHAPFLVWRPLGPVSDIIAQGGAGVDIFFGLSGFLITSILIATRGASNYFSAFYARRSLRIFPLAFFAIALFYWLEVPILHHYHQLPKLPESEQIYYWLFIGNWRQGLGFNDGAWLGHFWSLAIEEQFYLLFSLLAAWLRSRALAFAALAMVLMSVILRFVFSMRAGGADPILWRTTVMHLDPIALGALLACSARALRTAVQWRWILICVGTVGLFVHPPAGLEILSRGILATGLVAMASERSVPLLRSRVLTSCGKYSYAMYVLHPAWLIPPLAKRYPHSWTLMFVALIGGPALSWGIGWLSWRVFEGRLNGYKRLFPYRFKRVPDDNESPVVVAA